MPVAPWPRFRKPSPKELREVRPELLATEQSSKIADYLGHLGATFPQGRSAAYLQSMLKKLVVLT